MLSVTPTGKQEEVLALPAKGHIVVLGTAGSGKTTIALMRAQHLAHLPSTNQVLLVTFNRALVEYMRGISNSRSEKLVVENYHLFARGYLHSMGEMPRRNGILNKDGKKYYIERAVEVLKKQNPSESTLQRSQAFFVDEITYIEQFGLVDSTLYYDAERIGRRSANIKKKNRKWIFEVYKKYIELRKQAGWKYDWDDVAFYVYCALQKDKRERRYTHIIVDEGQDFSPMMIKSLIEAIADGGSFTFFGDVAQQIYGSRLSWRDSGIHVDNKIWRFDMNYRNPAAIIDFAKDITKSVYWRQNNDMIEAAAHIAEGPKPVLVKFTCEQHEIDWVIDRVISMGKTSSTVIVCRSRADINLFRRLLNNNSCGATKIDKNTPGYANIKTVYLTTFHAAKGLEFDNVFTPFLSDDKFPSPEAMGNGVSEEDVYEDEIKLLYVAATRSKYGLYMSYSGTLSPLFPKDAGSYDFQDEADVI